MGTHSRRAPGYTVKKPRESPSPFLRYNSLWGKDVTTGIKTNVKSQRNPNENKALSQRNQILEGLNPLKARPSPAHLCFYSSHLIWREEVWPLLSEPLRLSQGDWQGARAPKGQNAVVTINFLWQLRSKNGTEQVTSTQKGTVFPKEVNFPDTTWSKRPSLPTWLPTIAQLISLLLSLCFALNRTKRKILLKPGSQV